MQIFDKTKVKSNFNKANKSYNQNANLQKIVANQLVDIAKEDIKNSQTILDLGSGTGFVVDKILSEFSDKEIFQLDIALQMLLESQFKTTKIVADIESLPFKNSAFDLAISSLSFQWLNDLKNSILNSLYTVKEDGVLHFSLLVDDTLKELKQACKNCDVKLSLNDFTSQNDLEKILTSLNLKYELQFKTIVLEYQGFYQLLKSIKSIGAGYSKNRQYIGKKQFDTIAKFYLKNFNLNNKVSATWQVVFISIRKNRNV